MHTFLATAHPILIAAMQQWQQRLAPYLHAAAPSARQARQALLARLAPYEAALEERLAAWNADEQREVLTHWQDTETMPDVTTDATQHQLRRRLGAVLLALWLAEWRRQGGTGIPAETALQPLLAQITQSATAYTQTTQRWLTARLAALERQGRPAAVEQAITEVYDRSTSVRARQLAATEATRAALSAQVAAWQDASMTLATWRTAGDSNVCEFCVNLEGTTVHLGETLFEQGDVVPGTRGGEMTLTYDDLAHPPLHIGCRCHLEPKD